MTAKRQSNATANETVSDLRRRIRDEGAKEAFAALRAVCNDPKAPAPAPARAAAATSIFRAAGLFTKTDDVDDKPQSEMTAAELAAMIRRLEKSMDADEGPVDDQPDVFE